MNQNIDILLDMIKSQIDGTPCDVSRFLALSPEEQQALAAVAKSQSLAQFLGNALGKAPEAAGLPITGALVRESMVALSYTLKIEKERKAICRVFEQAHIPYIQLKGARIRPYYPEVWMRTSCDNDILVHEEELEKATQLLVDQLGYKAGFKDHHDISLYSKNDIHLELHFTINGNHDRINQVLNHVWDEENISHVPDSCEVLQSNEHFLFHIIAHTANHFLGGGCGMRPLVDLYLLRKKMPFDEEKLMDLCEQAGIDQFYRNLLLLIHIWFEHGTHTPVTEHMEEFILSGGVYGTKRNRVAVAQHTTGRKAGCIRYQVFLPFDQLCRMYPNLRNHAWLMPVYQVLRWSRLVFKGRYKKIQNDIKLINSFDADYSDGIEQMLRENNLL